MTTGTYISGVGHTALIVWLVAGWGMSSEPLEFQVTEVSLVSGAEFEALVRAGQPDAPPSEVVAPVTPPAPETPPETPAPVEETPPVVPPAPPPVEAPVEETPPVQPEIAPPPADVVDTPPEVAEVPQVIAPPPTAELGTSLRPKPRPAPRVAPQVVAPPPPDAVVAPDVQTAATDQATEEALPAEEPAENTTAPEEAVDEIVTEAETPEAGAVQTSVRPQVRPNRPTPPASQPATETQTAEAAQPAQDDAVAAALAAANAATQPQPATQGAGGADLSDAQKASFLRQIENCWTLGAASSAAMQTRIRVNFVVLPGGLVDANSIALAGFEGGTQADADVAFRIARSAIARCQFDGGRNGYDVPAEQFTVARDVTMVFDPSEMRTR